MRFIIFYVDHFPVSISEASSSRWDLQQIESQLHKQKRVQL